MPTYSQICQVFQYFEMVTITTVKIYCKQDIYNIFDSTCLFVFSLVSLLGLKFTVISQFSPSVNTKSETMSFGDL